MQNWFTQVEASSQDLDLVRRSFSERVLRVETQGHEKFLFSPRFDPCNSASEVRAKALELLANLNVTMEISEGRFEGIQLLGVVERIDGKLHRTMFAEFVAFGSGFATAVAIAVGPDGQSIPPGPQARSFVERMTELIERDERVREVAFALRTKPTSWGNLSLVYETVKGLISPRGDRQDWQYLVTLGWISKDDSNRFFETAAYYRHGHPREPIRCYSPMLLDDAVPLIHGLFKRMVEHLQPL